MANQPLPRPHPQNRVYEKPGYLRALHALVMTLGAAIAISAIAVVAALLANSVT